MTPLEWGEKALVRIVQAKDQVEMDAFVDKHVDKIAKLRISVPQIHKQIVAEIQRRHAEFAA